MATKPAADVRAVRHKILTDFLDEVKQGFITETFTVYKHKWKMQTPSEDEVVWSDKFVQSSTPVAFVTSRRAPKLAVAIREIDGVPVDQMFDYPPAMDQEARDALKRDDIQRKYWVYGQMMAYLLESVPSPVVEALYDKYDELMKRQHTALDQAAQELPNS